MACQYFAPCEGGVDTFSIAMPKVTFGRGCLAEVGDRARALGMRRAALFTDSFLSAREPVATARDALARAGLQVTVFDEVRIEPDDASISAAADFFRDGKFDGAVSVGGGSTIDTAKAAMLYARYPAEFTEYFGAPIGAGRAVEGDLPPHLACPTTCGTGSECTSVAVIRLRALNCKFVLGAPGLLPDEALVDPACCDSLPRNVTASSGFDLLCHAFECYTAKAYTQRQAGETYRKQPAARSLLQGANPWSDMAARRALEIVGAYLERGVSDAGDFEARDQLTWGATLAGMAFGNSGTHLPHAMSYGVTHLMRDITTEDYREASPFVPHGISVAVNAPAIFRRIAEAAPARHLQAAEFLAADCAGAALDDAGEVVAARIIALMRNTGLPNGLSAIGFVADDARALAASAVRQQRAIANAPRMVDESEMREIYANAMRYW